ncbi:MAG: cytochrome B5 [Clostridia bacterium]|nr:cytochrome B5 [Clostridia bacterium]
MPKSSQIQEQLRNITGEIYYYVNSLYMISCVYTRNAILNQIRHRLYYSSLLINQLNTTHALPGASTTTSNTFQYTINPVQSSILPSSESGIEQLTQGIQPSGLQNIVSMPAQSGQVNQAVFTLDQLSRYDGINGNPAYVAVNGVVYDVTNIATWAAATHFGLVAGRDLTQEFTSCHAGQNILSKLKVVGRLVQ